MAVCASLMGIGFCGLQLQKIAPEFYLTLKHHTSWCYVIWAFLTDPEVRCLVYTADVQLSSSGAGHVDVFSHASGNQWLSSDGFVALAVAGGSVDAHEAQDSGRRHP
jgi:hypothetical protein